MKILPSNKEQWWKLSSLPFKAYILGVGLFFTSWYLASRYHELRDVGFLVFGYFGSFIALLLIAVVQTLVKRYKMALWNIVFAFLAFFCGWTMTHIR